MGTNNLLNSVLLNNGEEAAEVTVAESSERVNLRLRSVQVGAASSQARLNCRDSQGRNKGTLSIDDSGVQELEIEAVQGALTVSVACQLGSCRVTLDEVTGVEGASGEGSGSTQSADIADGAITTAKLASGAVTTAKLGALAVDTAQLAAGAVETAKLDAGAVTGPKVDLSTLKVLSAVGNNGATTTLAVTGVLATDRLIAAFSAPTAGGALVAHPIGTDFAATPTANDQIDQLSVADLSDDTVVFILLPAAA